MLTQMTGGAGAIFQVNGFRGGTLPSRDEIRQIRFRTNSFSADNHDAGRVQVEIITKPNVRAWSGNANVGLRTDVLNARNAFAEERTPEQFRRFNMGIRGPIVAGRTSLRLNVDGNRSFDAGTIFALNPDGSRFQDQVKRPYEQTNVHARHRARAHRQADAAHRVQRPQRRRATTRASATSRCRRAPPSASRAASRRASRSRAWSARPASTRSGSRSTARDRKRRR